MKTVIILSIFLLIAKSSYSQDNKFCEAILDSMVTRNLAGEYVNKSEYEYDDINNQLIERIYYWDSDSWKEITKVKYDYDTNRNPISYISSVQSIGTDTDEWTKYGRNEIYYDANNIELYVCYGLGGSGAQIKIVKK